MSKTGFSAADILLPAKGNYETWAVVACDQFTSQPEYWERVEKTVGDNPSTFRIILPEAQLSDGHTEEHIDKIWWNPRPVVGDGDDDVLIVSDRADNNATALGIRFDGVINRIFREGLNGHKRAEHIAETRADINVIGQTVTQANLLNGEIIFDVIDFLPEGDKVVIFFFQGVAHHIGKSENHVLGFIGVF